MSARAAVLAVALLTVTVWPARVGANSSTPVDEGSIAVVVPTDVEHTIDSGGSGTLFGLRLPSGSSCPGDSANDNWRVDSFMVPESVDPGSLGFNGAGPVGDGQFPLYNVETNPYASILTEPNTGAGQPGRIQQTPPFTFSVFVPAATDYFSPGTYTIGLACTYDGLTRSYWHATMRMEADSDDQPAGLRWTVLDQASPTVVESEDASDGGSTTWVLAIALLGVAAAGIGFFVYRRRTTTPALKGS